MPWAQLTDLTFGCSINCSQPEIAFDILARCPNLVRALIFAGLYLPPKAGRDTLVLSYLRTLSVHYFGLAAGDSVSFLDITGLEVNYSGLTSDDLKAALRNAPSLNRLRIKYCSHCFDDAFIDALTYKDGVGPLAPHLHYLSIENMLFQDNTEDVMTSMIASR